MSTTGSIRPYHRGPIRHVPHYLYGSYNHYECKTYSDKSLARKKERAEIVAGTLYEKVQKHFPDPDTQLRELKKLDWFHTLIQVEKQFLASEELPRITPDTILQINTLLTRLLPDAQTRVESRQAMIYHSSSHTINERFARHYFERLASRFPDLLCAQWCPAPSDPEKLPPDFDVPIASLREEFDLFIQHPRLLGHIYKSTKGHAELDPTIIDEWIETHGTADGKFQAGRWLRDNFIYMPSPENIKPLLKRTLAQINDPHMHPIERAARMHIGILKVFPGMDANHRTARIIGSIVLLREGYLPPKISEEECPLFNRLVGAAMRTTDALPAFIDYFAQKVLDTQNEYKLQAKP